MMYQFYVKHSSAEKFSKTARKKDNSHFAYSPEYYRSECSLLCSKAQIVFYEEFWRVLREK
ncbi:hypothetical protein T01_4912 [Trichinella spiralis]|uniref:Uncharacterized protein n=1 Tax=Trichinella spiralis TaxID=6334 RepID=A0A0V1BIR1_TRISP|nr:hypothetical protein T01_4912 [Trichinella spiralis]